LHAKQRIREKKIELVWIEEAIKYPDKIEKEFGLYYNRKKLNGLTIEVVYEKEKYIKIITVYLV